uniref:Uncharacterized protein n=1 Tax=Lepeophtheirus salmonis TaxID=72036 RepID=A0A0K2U7M3_LEPSM
MALLWSLFCDASSSTDLNWKLFALGVSNEFTGLLLDVFCGTGRLINGTTFLGSLTVADLFQGLVTLLDGLFSGLLLECDLTDFLKVFFANLLLRGCELCHISVVTLFHVLVSTFEDGILLNTLNGFLFFYTAEACFRVILTSTEVNSS